ncbi:hypothetical protein HK405_004401 [Cladochytrium tenue]|nr:hypothetical protein HK405_004401 [Cladochytrium tenue]
MPTIGEPLQIPDLAAAFASAFSSIAESTASSQSGKSSPNHRRESDGISIPSLPPPPPPQQQDMNDSEALTNSHEAAEADFGEIFSRPNVSDASLLDGILEDTRLPPPPARISANRKRKRSSSETGTTRSPHMENNGTLDLVVAPGVVVGAELPHKERRNTADSAQGAFRTDSAANQADLETGQDTDAALRALREAVEGLLGSLAEGHHSIEDVAAAAAAAASLLSNGAVPVNDILGAATAVGLAQPPEIHARSALKAAPPPATTTDPEVPSPPASLSDESGAHVAVRPPSAHPETLAQAGGSCQRRPSSSLARTPSPPQKLHTFRPPLLARAPGVTSSPRDGALAPSATISKPLDAEQAHKEALSPVTASRRSSATEDLVASPRLPRPLVQDLADTGIAAIGPETPKAVDAQSPRANVGEAQNLREEESHPTVIATVVSMTAEAPLVPSGRDNSGNFVEQSPVRGSRPIPAATGTGKSMDNVGSLRSSVERSPGPGPRPTARAATAGDVPEMISAAARSGINRSDAPVVRGDSMDVGDAEEEDDEDGNHVCDMCGKRFSSRDALKRHENMDPIGKKMYCIVDGVGDGGAAGGGGPGAANVASDQRDSTPDENAESEERRSP